jgi:hypothetical protein
VGGRGPVLPALRRVEACIGDRIVYYEPSKVAIRERIHPRHRGSFCPRSPCA